MAPVRTSKAKYESKKAPDRSFHHEQSKCGAVQAVDSPHKPRQPWLEASDREWMCPHSLCLALRGRPSPKPGAHQEELRTSHVSMFILKYLPCQDVALSSRKAGFKMHTGEALRVQEQKDTRERVHTLSASTMSLHVHTST